MRRTLLQVVQAYLDTTSGFYVNSIFDTDESQQIAQIAERVYYEMVQEYPNLLFTMKQRTLGGLGDTERPNYMLIPEEVKKVEDSRMYYNASKEDGGLHYREVKYLTPQQFMSQLVRNTSRNTIIVEGFDQNKMVCATNQFPSYFTSFDNKYVVFDSYDSEYDTTLQASKSLVVTTEEEVFLQEDDFVIPIPDGLSETYLNMFLNEAMATVYQQVNPVIAQKARRARIKLQQDNRALGQSRGKKKYGRRTFVGSYVPRGHNAN
jgi:hypothetical protein